VSEYIHLVIRVSDAIYGLPSAVLRHNSTAFWHEGVWLGKPDRGLPASTIYRLNEQITAGFETCLYIIDPDRSNPVAYGGRLREVSSKSPPDKELIPPFYRELRILSRMKAWLKVGYLQGFSLTELPTLVDANTSYELFEREAFKKGVKRTPGDFLVIQKL
jgi:hypothetical protein